MKKKKNNKKYIVWSGWITDKKGKDLFITAEEVMKSYGLTKDVCILCNVDSPETYRNLDRTGKKVLFPRKDGRYILPKGK